MGDAQSDAYPIKSVCFSSEISISIHQSGLLVNRFFPLTAKKRKKFPPPEKGGGT